MVGKATSEGTKVTSGAPVMQEATGQVISSSLANESVQHGGEFSENRDVEPISEGDAATHISNPSYSENSKTGPSTRASTGASTAASTGTSRGSNRASERPSEGLGASQGSAAPTYVNAQYAGDAAPHGKNLHEGIDYSKTKDGIQAALNAEPGSIMDPARRAEEDFQQPSTVGAGPRDYGNAQQSTTYDDLKSDTQA